MNLSHLPILFETVKKYAPTIAKLISINNPALSIIINLLSNLFNSNPSDVHQLSTDIINDPNIIDKLTALEHITKIKTEIDFEENKS